MLFQHSWKNFIRGNEEVLRLHWIEQTLIALQRHRSALLIALALSVLYEVGTGVMWVISDETPELVGGFDWWDILSYMVGFAVAAFILRRWRRMMLLRQAERME